MTGVINMHDWLLLEIRFAWEEDRVRFFVRHDVSAYEELVAEGVSDLHIPQLKEWGPSASINELRGLIEEPNGQRTLEIEMQSGDVIRVVAANFIFPAATAKNR